MVAEWRWQKGRDSFHGMVRSSRPVWTGRWQRQQVWAQASSGKRPTRRAPSAAILQGSNLAITITSMEYPDRSCYSVCLGGYALFTAGSPRLTRLGKQQVALRGIAGLPRLLLVQHRLAAVRLDRRYCRRLIPRQLLLQLGNNLGKLPVAAVNVASSVARRQRYPRCQSQTRES